MESEKLNKHSDFVFLFLEKETAKIREELIKENHSLRLELEEIKAKSNILREELHGKIEIAESRITERAIDKAFSIVQQIKNWVGMAALALAAVTSAGVFIGYKNLTDSLSFSFKEKVNQWMRFDDEKSEGRKTLDELRTEALLNAYMIRLARNYSSGSTNLLHLNGPEEKRLLDVLQNPETSYSSFSDALTIIIKNRGPFRINLPEDSVGKTIASLISSEDISPYKRGLLVDRLKGDQALLPYSKEILKGESYDSYTKLSAFDNVKLHDRKFAIAFAKRNISEAEPILKEELSIFLAEETQNYSFALSYLESLIDQKPEYWKSRAIGVVSRLGETLPSTVNPQTDELAKFFCRVIELGARIELTDGQLGPKRVAINLGGSYSPLRKPATLLANRNLIKSTITNRQLTLEWLLAATDFFQIKDKEALLTTLILTPTEKALIETNKGSRLSKMTVEGDIWLRTKSFPGGKDLTATWRDRESGIVYTEQVLKIQNLADSKYQLSFDKDLLDSISYEYRSPDDFI